MGLFDDVLSQNRTTNAGSGLFDDVLGEQSPKPPAPKGGLMAAAKQGIGASIKGIGQAAADFLPGVTRDNPVSAYGQSVIDANPTAVNSLGDIVESPWQATKEAVGNAAGSMGSMLGARALGMGITAAAPFTGPAAPIVAGAGQLVANVGPFVAAALPSYGGIRESQILADPANEADGKSKAIAALGAGTVGAIEGAFGPEAWALAAMRKGGIESVAKKFADSKSIAGAVGKGIARGAAVEGAEELVQNPIEQAAGYQDPTTPQAIKETLFGGAMGSIGGGVIGGGMAGLSRAATQKAPVSEPQSVQPTSTDPAILPSGPPPGPLEKAAAIGEKTGVNEMKRQEQALSLTGVENEVSQTGIQNQGNSEVSAGLPSGTEGTEQTDIAIGAGSTEPSGDSLGIGDIPAQPTDVAPATLSGPATTAPQDESQAADVEPPPLNTPAAPEPPPSPVSTAATSPQILQAESAGVPTLTTEGVSSNAPQTQEAVSPAPGRKEESASVPGAGGVTSAASADADRKKDVDALAIQAARLRESASLAIGQKRVALNALASRMEAAAGEIARIANRKSAPAEESSAVQPVRKGVDLSTRTDGQLAFLARSKNPKVKALADAEIARREGGPQGVAPVVANEIPSDVPQAELSVTGNQQNVPGDIPTDISAPKSLPAETNQSTTEAVSKKPKAVQNNLPPIARRDDLVGAIMRVTGGDGIHSSMAPDTVGDSANRATKLRGLFTKRGTIDLGDVAMRLREDENFDVRDGEHLSEMIRQASFGEVPVSMARQERDADAAKEKEHRDRIREKAKKYGVKAVGVKFSDLESRVFAMMDARNKKAVAALDGRAQKRFEAAMSESQNALSDDELDAVLADLSQQGMSPRDFWNKAKATVLKMAEEARQERALDAEPTTEEPSWFADFPDESGNRSTGSGRESQPVDQAPSQPGLELAGQTADELAKQEAERVAAEKAQKADKAQAEADEKAATGRKAIKQASDAAASTFELGGDAMANLTGQVDMFATVATSKPAAAPIKPEGGPEDAAQDRPDGAHVFLKAPDGTVDFGEITPAMAESMKRQAGKIRLERGDDSYGEQHIELRHGKDIRGVGFKSVAEFVSEALQNISAIWKPSKTSQLVVVEAIEHGKVVFVELKPSDSGDYYTVNSAFPTPANYAEKKGKSAGWVKLWSGMALPPSAPAARTPSADRPSEKAGEGDATPSSKSSDSSVVNQTSESKPANTEDAGAELTHNRRNRLTRGLKWEDLASKDEALRVKEATKAKVYPKPDYKAMIDAGMPPQLAHIIKQVYDSIAISPQTSRSAAPSDDDIKSYIAGVNRVMDAVVEWAGSVDRGGAWLRNTIARAARAFGSAIDFSVASHVEAQNSLVNAAFPGGYAPVRNELVAIGGNKVYGALQPGARELNDAAKAIKSGWPESQEAWQRQGITVVNGNDVKAETSDAGYGKSATVVRFTVPNGAFSRSLKVVTVKGTRDADSPEVRKAIVDGLAEYSGRFLLLSKVKSVVSTHATEDEAKAAARSLVSRDGRKSTVSDKGISVTAAERIGEARRLPGEDISSDRLRDTFKFKGVNFGNWMKGEANAKERQLHLNHAYDSFMDLADVLGVPPESMSLNGMLGVAIGAQGSGGFAAAHFVPGVNEINLTRESGAGSLAHEWGHALDHYFARQAGLTRATDPFLTAHLKTAAGAEIRQEILDKFKDIVQAMRKRPITLEEAVAQRQEKIASARRNLDGWLNSVIRTDMRQDAEILKASERIKSGDLGDGAVAVGRTSAVKPAIAEFGRLIKEKTGRALQRTDLSAIDSWAENLKYLQSQVVEEATHVPQQMVDTRYARDAASLDKEKGGKPYWSTPLEMFARALDAFVSDTLEAKAAKNTYLSHAGRDGQTVPTGTERTAINAAIQGLVDTIETRAGENGNVLLFSREDSAIAGSSADRALYDMAQEGRTSAEILSFIGKASRRPFNRLLATHLARIGVSSTITLDSQGGWQFGNTSRAQRYAAAYNPRTDTVALFTPREAERHILHELVHAATLKAIASGGVSAMRMRRLFLHVQRSGRLRGQYGMSSLDEFVAEAFSNPRFQEALRSVPAPAGSTLKSAWQWFVRLVSRVLGLRTAGQETALDRALTAGAELMRENAALASGTEAVRFNSEARLAPNGNPSNLNEHQWQQVRTPEFKAWFGDWESAAKLEWLDTGKPIAMMSGDEVPVFPKLKLLAQWVGKYWADEHGGGVVNPDLGRIVLDETAASFSIGHGLSRSKANAFYLVPKVLENGVVLGQLPKVANKPDAYVIAAPVAIGEKTYRELVEVRIDQNMHRMYVHEVVLREESPDSAFNSSAASSSGKAEPQGARHGAIWNFMLSLRKVKASKAVDANGEPLASQVDQWEAEQSSGDLRYSLATDWYEAPRMAPVRNLVANALRSDKNTSWITPFNTQYHKAEKWAGEGKGRFKVVFNLVQRFLGDISKFAVMAQNAAPTLLHEWRTLSDVRETLAGGDLLGRQHRADVAAIASPLYEGTLYGGGNPMDGIKWSDDQLRARFKLSDRQIRLYHEALSAVKVSMDELAKSIISQHAKANSVNFDSDLPIGEMASGVIRRLEEARQDLDALLDPSEQERVDGEVADLREMDMNDEADRLKRDFARDRKNAALGVERIDKTIEDVQGIVVKNQALQDAGYFPLMRFGKHTVTAKDADGKVQFFGMYEGMPMIPRSGQYEANKVAAELRAAFPKWHVTTGIHNDQKHKLYQGMNIEAIQLFAEHMDQESLEPFQEFIRLKTNSRSAQRRLLHRKGTPGFDKDVRRTLAQFMVSNARAASSNYHMQDMVRAAEDAEKDGGDIGAEAIDLVDYVRNPTEEAQALRGFLFFQFLGGSLASAVVNLTQTPAMTLPYLSQFEPAKPLISRLAVASKTAAVGKPERINDQKLREALIRAEQDGVTAPQEIHQLTATAANNVFAGSRVGSALLRGWGAPFAMAEGFNRRIAFIAAFQIAEKMGPDLFAKTGFHDSFAFAEDAVNQTQGIYNKGNRMNVGRGAAGSVLMTFKQYSIMYMELLKRLPPKQRAIMVGVLILAAGGGGLPGVEDAEDLWDTLGQWLGFASNSRRTIRNTLTEVIGRDAADLAINGALSRMGIDLHSRLGMQNLIPGTGILKQSSVDKARDIEEFFGPAASVIKSVGDAVLSLATGHPERAAMTLAPNAIRNAVQGAKMAAKGYSEDAKGRKGVPVNELEAAAKMIGFNPKDVADYGAVKRDLAQDQRLINVKREEFSSALADAMIANDLAARTEALQSMREWNETNPDMRVSIMPAAIFKRVRDARAEGVDRMLKSLPKGMRSKAMEEFASG